MLMQFGTLHCTLNSIRSQLLPMYFLELPSTLLGYSLATVPCSWLTHFCCKGMAHELPHSPPLIMCTYLFAKATDSLGFVDSALRNPFKEELRNAAQLNRCYARLSVCCDCGT